MSDKQKSIVSLAHLTETCNAALASIAAADGFTPDDLSDLQNSDFSVIHKDFIALLEYLYSSSTKVALSLKPSSPTYSASLSPLKDLSTHVSNLSHNVRLVRHTHGLTLLKEMQESAQTIISAIQSFSQTLLSHLASSNELGEEYLTKVGEIHHAIEKVRGADGLSHNNVAAVRKIWSSDHESLEDALRELQEIPEESAADNEFDDGWDELGVDSSPSLSPEELERLKKVESVVKLTNLLHKTVIKRVLSSFLRRSPIQQEINSTIDLLAAASPALPAAVDDLISTTYSPQDRAEMSERLDHLNRVVGDIYSHLNALFALGPLGENPEGSAGTKKESPDVKKWFKTCFDELEKLINQAAKSLQDVE